MGCANSTQTREVYACAFCGLQFDTYEQADEHERKLCPKRPQLQRDDSDLVKVDGKGNSNNASVGLQVDPLTDADLDEILSGMQRCSDLPTLVEFTQRWRGRSTVPYVQGAKQNTKAKLCNGLCKAAKFATPLIEEELTTFAQFYVAQASSTTPSCTAFGDKKSAEAEFQRTAENSPATLLMDDAGVELQFQGDKNEWFATLRAACLDARKKVVQKEPIYKRYTVPAEQVPKLPVGTMFQIMLEDGSITELPVPTQCKFGIEVSYPVPSPPERGMEICLAVTRNLCAILSAVDECTTSENKDAIQLPNAATAVCKIHAHVVARSSVRHAKQALLFARQLGVKQLPELEIVTKNMSSELQFPKWWDLSIMEGLDMKDVQNFKVEHMDVTNLYGIIDLQGKELERIQKLFDATIRKKYTQDRKNQGSDGRVPDRLVVHKAWRVQNAQNWKEYSTRVDEVSKQLAAVRRKGGSTPVMDKVPKLKTDVPEFMDDPSLQLNVAANAAWLFHGTSAGEAIAKSDFRLDLVGSNAGTLYGRGVYLAESVSKSDEYSREDENGLRQILICRAALGNIHYTDEPFPNTTLLETKCTNGEEFHSVLGDREKCRGTFREFIVFDEDQVYPEFVVWYKREYNS
jgi:hypothetical protein|mmetsp:Transcript_34776/g.55595  ORF Transcript_34776/g.55595 Transcript_34776/m.55595 type:complete len:631 (+) Transcript_34776:100-1992(+)